MHQKGLVAWLSWTELTELTGNVPQCYCRVDSTGFKVFRPGFFELRVFLLVSSLQVFHVHHHNFHGLANTQLLQTQNTPACVTCYQPHKHNKKSKTAFSLTRSNARDGLKNLALLDVRTSSTSYARRRRCSNI